MGPAVAGDLPVPSTGSRVPKPGHPPGPVLARQDPLCSRTPRVHKTSRSNLLLQKDEQTQATPPRGPW